MKKFLLIYLTVLSIGCAKITAMNANAVYSSNKNTERLKVNEKNQSPEQPKLTAVLYDLAIASEPEHFAREHGIPLFNDDVRVFIYFDPESSCSDRKTIFKIHNIKIEKQSNDLARALVPVSQLISLAKEPVIQLISLPKTLQKTNR